MTLLIAAPLALSPLARAQAESTSVDAPSNDWSVGLGVGPSRSVVVAPLYGSSVGGLGGLGYGALGAALIYDASLERRIDGGAWMRMSAGFGYTRSGGDDEWLHGDLALGLRYAVFDLRGIELSPYLDLRLGYELMGLGAADPSGAAVRFSGERWSGETTLGLAVQYSAMDAFEVPLALRFGLDALRAGVSARNDRYLDAAGGQQSNASSTWFAAFDVQPRLELRLYF